METTLIFLLDTNIVVLLLNKDADLIRKIESESIVLGSIVLGELYYGAQKSARSKANLERIEEFIHGYPIVDCNKEAAQQYGLLKRALEAKGRLIPENDMWIAALAMHYQLALVTRDEHFNRVHGLHVEKW